MTLDEAFDTLYKYRGTLFDRIRDIKRNYQEWELPMKDRVKLAELDAEKLGVDRGLELIRKCLSSDA
ncbi:hypothetical protein LCGC14_1664640 [marine sediment metagenome]|uniref:Uncharacterized protein n=1 Tax=marine sediment metagenome TaxID=412755 RepID=A0A0F9HTU9_9ZZZZ|nr:hypothetical protein [Phycisphaerae bacterium]HDZ44267.1 hypothetical protein [Phycisphaerae bacterium]